MKVVIDEDLPRSLSETLTSLGFGVVEKKVEIII